jgi:hypothetical protein
MNILAIDPGNVISGYVIISAESKAKFKILEHGSIANLELLNKINVSSKFIDVALIEMIQSYNQPVGNTVFDTCRWVGKYELMLEQARIKKALIPRPSIIAHHLGAIAQKSADSKIRQRLLKDFKEDCKGVTSHAWQALALAVMYLERYENFEV